jgi:hypothetical protein
MRDDSPEEQLVEIPRADEFPHESLRPEGA